MTVWQLMRPQLRKAWPLVAVQVGCLVANSLVTVGVARVIQAITNSVIASDWGAVAGQFWAAVGLIAAGVVCSFGATAAGGSFGSYVSRELRSETLRRMLSFPYGYYESHHSGDLVSKLTNDIGRIQGFFENTLGNLVREPLIFMVVSVWLAIIDPWLLAPTMVLTAVLVVYNLRQGKKVVEHYRQQQEGFGELTKAVQDTVQGVGVVKVYGLQGKMMDRILRASGKIADHMLGIIAIGARRSLVSAFCRNIPFLVTLFWGGWRTLHGELSPGALFAFLYLYRYLNGALGYLPDLLTETQGIRGVVDRVAVLYAEPQERTTGSAVEPRSSGPLLEVRGVRFAYSPDQPVLQGLDFVVERGQTVALVGTSGCGKSTLLRLLCGLDDPTGGEILLHGQTYQAWSLARLRDNFSLVSQDTFLFPATVAENIGYGAVDTDQGEIARAAALAGADVFIEALPDGYQTQVGERGIRLSGGQRQRIAIARALLKDAPILLLDEPTSSLDAESEALVQAAIDRLMAGRTVIVAAHRLRTVRQAHQILVIEEGRIVEQGTHDALLAADGPYRRLYSKQMEGGA